MNPLLFVLPAGLVLYFLTKGDDKSSPKGQQKAPASPASTSSATAAAPAAAAPSSSAPSEKAFVPSSYEFADKNGVVWVIKQEGEYDWTSRIKSDPSMTPGYEFGWDESVKSKWQPKGGVKELVEMMINALALEVAIDNGKQEQSGKAAGLADANASIQAYKDSDFGYKVRPLYPRWDKTKGIAWKNAYNKEFNAQISNYGYWIEMNGACCDKWYIHKKSVFSS